ncbi:MAG: filamentous hemagglutinin N-terminal domain-containing protein [Cyanobacteria bacterium P01_F01_bin.150]
MASTASIRTHLIIAFTLLGVFQVGAESAIAQLIPDTTLGAENSFITPSVTIQGDVGDRIDGGAVRGSNLFHSFDQFNINDGQRVYFANPTGVETILSRVTGANGSNILGTLGVDGTADLFFLNPNGIVFGQNARLDVAGSFLATSANAFQFQNREVFGATELVPPSPLLTIKPSALFFTRSPAGSIINRSITSIAPGLSFPVGLRVPNGEQLALVGGPVRIEGGRLSAFGGRVDVGSVGEEGIVTLNADGRLGFPNALERDDVLLDNSAGIETRLADSGDISITARNIDILNRSVLKSGIDTDFDISDAQAGDIVLDASQTIQIDQSAIDNFVSENITGNAGNIFLSANTLAMRNNSQLASVNFGTGNSGNVSVDARNRVLLDTNSGIFTNSSPGLIGSSGEISITTNVLEMTDGSQLQSAALGFGDAGEIRLNVRDRIIFNNSAMISDVKVGAVGNGGNIDIITNILELSDRSLVQASTLGNGNAGDINIVVDDRITLDTSAFIRSDVDETGIGNAGNINITTASLEMQNLSSLFATTFGQGNAGDIEVSATDSILLNNASIFGDVGASAIGTGGNINITSGSLEMTNLSIISADTVGQGDAGNIIIDVQDVIQLDNISQIGTFVQPNAIGQGGNIVIKTGSMELFDFSQISSSTLGDGDAGQISITAQNHIVLDSSLISSLIFLDAKGTAGNLSLTANSLELRDFSNLSSTTIGQGNAGDIIINASDRVTLANSGIASNVFFGGEGDGGDISITARALQLSNLSTLAANSSGVGNSGSIILNVRDRIVLDAGIAATSVERNAIGNAGNIIINADSLILRNGAQLVSSTFSEGNVGNIRITARDRISLTGKNLRGNSSAIFASTEPESSGQSGTIRITTPQFTMADGAVVNTRTLSSEDGGNIVINADQIRARNGSQIITTTFSQGQAGNIILNANDRVLVTGIGQPPAADKREPIVELFGLNSQFERVLDEIEYEISNQLTQQIIEDSRQMFAEIFVVLEQTTRDRIDQQFEVLANVSDTVDTGASGLYANTQIEATGNGGDIRIQGPGLISIADSAQISATTSGQGTAGNIIIRDTGHVELSNGSISTAVEADAKVTMPAQTRGNIVIRSQNLQLNDQSTISASTSGFGDAGNIIIREADTVHLFDSAITTAVQDDASGDGGQIILQTDNLTLGDRAQITSTTAGQGQAGVIDINANSVMANQGSRFESQTLGDRPAGNINLRVRDTITLAGDGTGIFASTAPESGGRGGNIFIDPELVMLENGAVITVDSQGDGIGGDIELIADRLILDDGQILAATDSTDGGNITLNLADLLVLRNNSQLSAEAGRNQSGGNGGNVTLRVPFVVAIPDENSDIIATAFEGNGGNINIETARIFGMEERSGTRDELQTNQTNDISASSQFGTDGVITIADLGIDPVQAIAELPVETASPSLSQGCTPGGGRGNFVNTGQGGIPLGPGDVRGSDRAWEDISPPDRTEAYAITEAHTWTMNDRGQVVLQSEPEAENVQLTCRS